MNVTGLPEWLKPAVIRSLEAVWEEIPRTLEIDREGTLALVATRLFSGYDIQVKDEGKNTTVKFQAHPAEKISPEIQIIKPELRDKVLEWFNADIFNLNEKIFELVKDLPKSAFTWSDDELRAQIEKIISSTIPGYEFSQQIYISQDSTLINITIRPSSNMILAIRPSMYSRTLPVMLQSDLEAKIIPALSALIGVPVKWAEKHKTDIEKLAGEFLEDKHSVENMRAEVKVKFEAETISLLEARVDSPDFMFQMWVSAYAGLDERYPEVGTFFGFQPSWKLHQEFYTELILSLDDFALTARLGTRIELIDNFWAGIEKQWPGNDYYFRVHYIPVKFRRPYAWWRYSPVLRAHEAALGYNFDEHISLEIYYDNTGEDKLGLRGLWHL